MSSGLADQPRRARGEVGRDRDRVGKLDRVSEEHARQEDIKNREGIELESGRARCRLMLGPELQEPGGGLFELAEVLSLGCVERRRGLVG